MLCGTLGSIAVIRLGLCCVAHYVVYWSKGCVADYVVKQLEGLIGAVQHSTQYSSQGARSVLCGTSSGIAVRRLDQCCVAPYVIQQLEGLVGVVWHTLWYSGQKAWLVLCCTLCGIVVRRLGWCCVANLLIVSQIKTNFYVSESKANETNLVKILVNLLIIIKNTLVFEFFIKVNLNLDNDH